VPARALKIGAMTSESPTNIPEWSVSELSGALKRTLEDAFGFVRLRGEISGYRGPHSSGHVYFSLKDQNAKIEAVIWKGVFGRLRVKPQEGLEVIATGKITTFPGKSSYQIVIDSLEPAGIGALMALLDERRRKLEAEGLFAEAKKRPLPYLPRVIGVVTSPTGAVIRDILHRLADRFPRHVIVWPVRVQGETSAAEVTAAIYGFNALPLDGPIPRPDVLIVARGGGSLEDLWSFNEESVVRAAADSTIPLVAAIGHETDWTLIDLAADRRAPTPTGAAEMVVPVRADLVAALADLARRQALAVARGLERRRSDLRGLARVLPTPDTLVAGPRQRLDHAATRLVAGLARNAKAHERRLRELSLRLSRRAPATRLAAMSARLEALGPRLGRLGADIAPRRTRDLAVLSGRLSAARAALARTQQAQLARSRADIAALSARMTRALTVARRQRAERLNALAQLLANLGHRSVLARGFALVRSGGQLIPRAAGLVHGAPVEIEFADGRVLVGAGGETSPKMALPKPKPGKPPGPQGSLF
jgi:exodeoxyribonuclease VII large subunit